MIIKDLRQLKRLATEENEFYLLLSNNIISSKLIVWDEGIGKFFVLHYINEVTEWLSPKELSKSNIGLAMRKNNLYAKKNC